MGRLVGFGVLILAAFGLLVAVSSCSTALNSGSDQNTANLQATIISQNATISAQQRNVPQVAQPAPIQVAQPAPAQVSQPVQPQPQSSGQGSQANNTTSGQVQVAAAPVVQCPPGDNTGQNVTKTLTYMLPQGCVAIIEGYTVDGQTLVFKAVRGNGGQISATIQDGAVTIVPESSGASTFCNRLQIEKNIPFRSIQPLAGWPSC